MKFKKGKPYTTNRVIHFQEYDGTKEFNPLAKIHRIKKGSTLLFLGQEELEFKAESGKIYTLYALVFLDKEARRVSVNFPDYHDAEEYLEWMEERKTGTER